MSLLFLRLLLLLLLMMSLLFASKVVLISNRHHFDFTQMDLTQIEWLTLKITNTKLDFIQILGYLCHISPRSICTHGHTRWSCEAITIDVFLYHNSLSLSCSRSRSHSRSRSLSLSRSPSIFLFLAKTAETVAVKPDHIAPSF